MANTPEEICSLALMEPGGEPIDSFADDIDEVRICNRFYVPARRRMIAAHKWNFARKMVSLAQDDAYVFIDDLFSYAYVFPADYLKFSRTKDTDVFYDVREQHILSNENPFIIEYVADIENTGLFPEWFTNMLVKYLKTLLVTKLKNKMSRNIQFYMAEFLEAKSIAEAENARERKIPREYTTGHTRSTDTWLQNFSI